MSDLTTETPFWFRLSLTGRTILVAVTALLVFAGAVPSGFALDDAVAVVDNPVVQGTVPWWEAFIRDWWGQLPELTSGPYRPLAVLMLRTEWMLGGGHPWLFHAVNVLLHAGFCALVFRALRGITSEKVAFATAILVSMIAASAEAVHAIVGQADILGAMAVVAGFMAHRRAGSRAALLAATAFGLGLGLKETGIVAFVAWTAFDWLLPPATPWRQRLGRYGIYAVLATGYFALRYKAIGTMKLPVYIDPILNPVAAHGTVGRIFGAGRVFLERYVAGIIDPSRRIYECSASACGPSDPTDVTAWLGLLLVTLLALSPLLLRRRSPVMAAGLAWWCIFFIPVANFLMPSTLVYGERLLYLPMVGLALAAAALAEHLSRLNLAVSAGWGLLFALAGGNALAIQVRHGDWRTQDALYRSALPYVPDSVMVLTHNAGSANQAGDFATAEQLARRAVSLQDGYGFAHAVLAVALDSQNKPAEAEAEFRKAIAATPQSHIIADFATFLARRGRLPAALQVVRDRMRIDPGSVRLIQLEKQIVQVMAKKASAQQ